MWPFRRKEKKLTRARVQDHQGVNSLIVTIESEGEKINREEIDELLRYTRFWTEIEQADSIIITRGGVQLTPNKLGNIEKVKPFHEMAMSDQLSDTEAAASASAAARDFDIDLDSIRYNDFTHPKTKLKYRIILSQIMRQWRSFLKKNASKYSRRKATTKP